MDVRGLGSATPVHPANGARRARRERMLPRALRVPLLEPRKHWKGMGCVKHVYAREAWSFGLCAGLGFSQRERVTYRSALCPGVALICCFRCHHPPNL